MGGGFGGLRGRTGPMPTMLIPIREAVPDPACHNRPMHRSRQNSLFVRKSLEHVRHETRTHGLRKALGPIDLMFLGVGSTIGAGIYVMTGTAAATFAGPAVLISFVIAGFACAFAALCYAELASAMPVSGSSYTYAYATLGEVFAWVLGWLIVLEYGVAGATVAVGFSGYFNSLMADFGIHIPAALTTPSIYVADAGTGRISIGGSVNLIAALIILLVTLPLLRGVSQSAAINSVIVAIKAGILLLFVAIGSGAVDPANWTPFIPPNEGGFSYGWPGVFRAASVIFFAYIGFETVSTAGAEARNPQRDLPIGILGALTACTLLYIGVAAVLTGVVPFRELGVPDPLGVAVEAMRKPWFGLLVKLGAVIGLSSVLLVLSYGQSRVFFAMARDGLMPAFFARLHPRYRTPWLGTIALACGMGTAAAFLPITLLGDLVSLGTAVSFMIICFTVLWLRNTQPGIHRPFRVPLGGIRVRGRWIGVAPCLGILLCGAMAGPLVFDVIHKIGVGNPVPALLLGGHALIGLAIYVFYGHRHSRLGQGLAPESLPPAPVPLS